MSDETQEPPIAIVPYPPRLTDANLERLIEQRCGYGWEYKAWPPERQAHARLNIDRRVRLKLWLTQGLGVTLERPKRPFA